VPFFGGFLSYCVLKGEKMILESKHGRYVTIGGKVPESVYHTLVEHKVNRSSLIERLLTEEAARLDGGA